MKGAADYAVVYDISSDSERLKVNKVLEGFGFRVQKSVFECRMNRKAKIELIDALDKLDIKTGFIKVYRLEYQSKTDVIGKEKEKNIDGKN
ncbi:MAG: CRISPR-associated endonuclease Cas2, partial [Bacteroidota bacterium]